MLHRRTTILPISCVILVGLSFLLGPLRAGGSTNSTNRYSPLEQRLADARAALATADAHIPASSSRQTAAIEQLFDCLSEAQELGGQEAEALAMRDLELRRDEENMGSVAYALALERLARVQFAHDRFSDAMTTGERAQSMLQSSAPRDDDALATVQITLGRLITAQSRYRDAIAVLEPAIATLDARHTVDLRLHLALQVLAYDYLTLPKLAPGQKAIERAISVAVTLEGTDGFLQADDRIVEQTILRLHGNLAGAIGTVEHALPVIRDTRPQRTASLNRALLTLGQLYQATGDCQRAEPLYREAIAIDTAQQLTQGYVLAALYTDLGQCLAHDGRYTEAADFQQRALNRYRQIIGPDGRKSLIAENDLATSYAYLGHLDEAAALLRHVVAANDHDPASMDSYTLQARFNLGAIDVWQGRYAEAERWYRGYLAHAGAHQGLGSDYPRASSEGLVASLWAQGRGDEAFSEALALGQYDLRIVRDAGSGLDESHTISLHIKQSSSDLSWALAIAAKTQRPEQVRALWALLLESRGLATAISSGRLAAVRRADNPEITAAWNDWKQRDEALVEARVDAARDAAPHPDRLATAERAFDEADRALARAIGVRVSSRHETRAALSAIRAALPPDVALVSYAEADSSEPRDLQRPVAERHGRLYALVTTRTAAPQLIDLGPSAGVQPIVRQWLEQIVDRNANASLRDDAGRRAREQIWDPIAARFPQRRVLILPSAMLERAPFAALTGPDGRYLVESGYAFHLLDHERDVLAAATSRDATATLSLIGAPDFSIAANDDGPRGVCNALRGATFTALPEAAREIDALRALWMERAGARPPAVLTGAEATETNARATLPGSRIVHFATHGVFLGDRCQESASDARGIKSVDTRSPTQSDLSALVLTGANRAAESSENDGLLTSEEISVFDLSAADWAVLSACDSGIGKNVNNEGVFGLRRAFRLAGARTVVMSLWPVSDASSADWMVALYRARLQQHQSTMDSVRTADLTLIKHRRDAGLDPAPYYWAAFVAAGDWR